MSSACDSEVERAADACESEDQKTEVHRQDFCCSVSRGQVRMIQLCKKTVEFPMIQHIDQIVFVAVAMCDSSHRFRKRD